MLSDEWNCEVGTEKMLSDEWNCEVKMVESEGCYLMSGTVRLVESEDVI